MKIYDANGFFAEAPVSTGMRGHPTPMGVFSVIQKQKLHHSNIYSGAPMPFMQRITWSGIAMHAGVLPGYPASHGCIRMPMAFAVKMYGWTKMGARVVITPGEITPRQFFASAAGRAEGRAAAGCRREPSRTSRSRSRRNAGRRNQAPRLRRQLRAETRRPYRGCRQHPAGDDSPGHEVGCNAGNRCRRDRRSRSEWPTTKMEAANAEAGKTGRCEQADAKTERSSVRWR